MPLQIEHGFFSPITEVVHQLEKKVLVWAPGHYDMSVSATEEALYRLLPVGGLSQVTADLRQTFSRINGLDLLGQGSRFVQLGFDTSLAVCLGYYKPRLQKNIDRSTVKLLESDVMLPETWDIIQKYSPFHMIICTPGAGGGFAWGGRVNDFYMFMDRSLRTLTVNGKFFYSDIGTAAPAPASYIQERRYAQHGIHIEMTRTPLTNQSITEFSITRLS